jgi:hypothetical protein
MTGKVQVLELLGRAFLELADISSFPYERRIGYFIVRHVLRRFRVLVQNVVREELLLLLLAFGFGLRGLDGLPRAAY